MQNQMENEEFPSSTADAVSLPLEGEGSLSSPNDAVGWGLAPAEESADNTVEAAYGSPAKPAESTADTKSHLTSSVPRAASVPTGAMTKQELSEARALFMGLDDGEIHRLYKKVTQ